MHTQRSTMPSHVEGTPKGEELVQKKGREPGRGKHGAHRTARDSTSVNPEGRAPIHPAMPHIPPQ